MEIQNIRNPQFRESLSMAIWYQAKKLLNYLLIHCIYIIRTQEIKIHVAWECSDSRT